MLGKVRKQVRGLCVELSNATLAEGAACICPRDEDEERAPAISFSDNWLGEPCALRDGNCDNEFNMTENLHAQARWKACVSAQSTPSILLTILLLMPRVGH